MVSDEGKEPLVKRLRDAAHGYPEWRVQSPGGGSYCFSLTRDDSINPERECEAWLEDHRKNFPESAYVSYEVAEVRVMTQTDSLMLEAADALAKMGWLL